MSAAERWLKGVLWWFGGVSALAAFPFVMPWRWMVLVHEWLGMGVLTHQPVVEYLAGLLPRYARFMAGCSFSWRGT